VKNGFRFFDCDLHVVEPLSIWQERLPEPFRSATKFGATLPNAPVPFEFDLNGRRFTGTDPVMRRKIPGRLDIQPNLLEASRNPTPEIYERDFDIEGIDVGVITPTTFLFMCAIDGMDPDYSLAICQAYNDWLAEFCSAKPDRLKFYAWLPKHSARLAAREARRCVEELGAVGVAMTTAPIDGRLHSDPFFDPLWEELNGLNVPLGLHGYAGNTGVRDNMAHRYTGHYRAEVTARVFTDVVHAQSFLAEVILSGVLQRFPNLKPIIFEVGASWLTWLLAAIDGRWNYLGPAVDYTLDLTPREYFRRQCFISIDPDEEGIEHLVEDGWAGNLLVSTDYPHHDCAFPRAVEEFLSLNIPDEAKRQIGWDNAMRIFDIKSGIKIPEAVA